MPERLLAESFREQYGESKYPFADDATLLTTTGVRGVPRGALTDATLYPVGADGGLLYLSTIAVDDDTVTFTIADDSRKPVATAEFSPRTVGELVTVEDEYARPAGLLVNGRGQLAEFSTWENGTYQFSRTSTAFLPRCVIPVPAPGVRGILTDAGDLFTGDFLLVGANGVVVREGDAADRIRIDVVGDPLFRRKLCRPLNLFTTPQFVQTINGCKGDRYGNFTIAVGSNIAENTIVRVYARDGELVIEAVGQTLW